MSCFLAFMSFDQYFQRTVMGRTKDLMELDTPCFQTKREQCWFFCFFVCFFVCFPVLFLETHNSKLPLFGLFIIAPVYFTVIVFSNINLVPLQDSSLHVQSLALQSPWVYFEIQFCKINSWPFLYYVIVAYRVSIFTIK